MYQCILAALDDSARALHVLAVAHELAERFDARLLLFRAIEGAQTFPPAAYTASRKDSFASYLEQQAHAQLDSLAAGLPRAEAHPPVIGFGSAVASILEAAHDLDVDLIVIGSHGYFGIDRLVGTNAARIANHASSHVLVVHDKVD